MPGTKEDWPLFNHQLDIGDSLEEMWHSAPAIEGSPKEFRVVEYRGHLLEISALTEAESRLSTPEVMKQNFLAAGDHLKKLSEFGLNTLSHTYEIAKRRQHVRQLLRPLHGQGRIIGFSACPDLNVDDVHLFSAYHTLTEQLPAEAEQQIDAQVIEPALRYTDWWLNQTRYSTLFAHLGLADSYGLYLPTHQLFLLDITPANMSDVGTTFRESHEIGTVAIQNYRRTIESL